LKVVQIGVGGWGKNHSRVLSEFGVLSAVCDTSSQRAKEFGKKYSVNSYNSFESLLEHEEFDAALVCTPTFTHSDITKRLIENKKHVFVEKPMATKYLDAKKMYLTAKKNKKILSVGHNRRYSSVSDFINNLNCQKKIGKILHIDSNFSAPGALNYKKKFWRANRKESPGGAIAGLGIHMIDLMCFFGGEVKSVQSLVRKYAVKVNIDDTTSAIFEFKKNCTGNLTTIFACPYTTTFNIFGTNMNIFSDVDKNKIKIIYKNGKIQKINLTNKNTLFLELQEFANNCKNKKNYRIKNSEAAHNVKVMEAIVKSSKKNKKIYL